MTDFINTKGERVSVVRNPDGSYTVTSDQGGSTQYGANDAGGNLARDWSLEGTNFSLDQVDGSDAEGNSTSTSTTINNGDDNSNEGQQIDTDDHDDDHDHDTGHDDDHDADHDADHGADHDNDAG